MADNKKTIFLNTIIILIIYCSFTIISSYLFGFCGGTWALLDNSSFCLPESYSSDLVQPYLIIQDTLTNVDSLKTWNYSPALYIFPDWLLVLPIAVLCAKNSVLPLLYAPLLLTFYAIAIGSLISMIFNKKFALATIIGAAVLMLSKVATIIFANSGNVSAMASTWLVSPYIHTGAVLMWIFCATLLIKIIKNEINTKTFILLIVLVFLISISDRIFTVWFVAPGFLTVLLLAYSTRSKRLALYASLVVLSSLSAAALEHFLRKNSIVVAATSGTLEKFLNDFFGIVKHGDFLFIALLIINFTICFRALFIAVKMFRRYTTSNYENLELFLGLSILFTFAVPLVLKMYFDLALWRYFLISFIIPIVWISVISAKYAVTKNKEYIIFVLSAILILACTIIFTPKAFDTFKAFLRPSKLEICLNNAGLTEGYGDYWNSKSLMFFSDRRLHIVQIETNMTPMRFNYNEDWFSKNAKNERPLALNFILTKNLDEKQIAAKFGTPSSVSICGDDKIWIYNKILPPPHLNVK